MPVRVRFLYGAERMDPARARRWLDQGHVALPRWATDALLGLFLDNWSRDYGFLQQAEFVRHFDMYGEQYELLAGLRDLAEDIRRHFPPHVYHYVGIGRSPAPVIAALQNAGCRAFTIPLSKFRPRDPSSYSITDRVLAGPRLTPVQSDLVRAHFSAYLGQVARNRILLIDYGQSAQSLVAAQQQLQHAVAGQHGGREVHALALCRSGGDEAVVRAVPQRIERVSWWHPLDAMVNADARRRFADRWHVLPLAPFGAASHRQELVQAALSGQRFDALAEHGSFAILDPGAPAAPVRYQAPGETGYEALAAELRNAR